MIQKGQHAICRQYDLARITDSNDRCTANATVAQKKNEYQQDWVRERLNGFSTGGYVNLRTGETGTSMDSLDYDISVNGQTWLHLFGPHCRSANGIWELNRVLLAMANEKCQMTYGKLNGPLSTLIHIFRQFLGPPIYSLINPSNIN